MKYIYAHLISGVSMLLMLTPVSGAPLTLQQAWSLAEQHSPSIKVARNLAEGAQAALETAS